MSLVANETFGDRLRRYAEQSIEARLERLRMTPDELGEAISNKTDEVLSQRPQPSSWSAKEIVCHLRDIEELVIMRFHLMLAMDDPKVFVAALPPQHPEQWGIDDQVPYPADPNRWAEERQYLRNDAALALTAFRRRRLEALTLLKRLSSEQWKRGCILPDGRRVTFENWTAAMAAHDDGHVAQIRSALSRA